jgi:hypothetical protein
MKQSSILFCSALVASIFLVGARTSHAQAPVWRCTNGPCDESVINDLEDIINRDWPTSLFILIPGIPYSCQEITDVCPRCATKGPAANADPSTKATSSAQPAITPQFIQNGVAHAWGVSLSAGDLRSFLIGRFTASASITSGSVLTSLTGTTWSGTSINYDFGEANHEVPVPGGSSGIQDLGAVNGSSAEGSFWTANVPFQFTVPTADIILSCTVGYGNNTVLVHPGGPNINISYPISATPVRDVLAEAVRNLFRRAAKLAALGMSCPDHGAGLCRAPSSIATSESPLALSSELRLATSPDLEVHVDGKVIAWRSDELHAASRPLKTVATLTSEEQGRLGSRQGWSLRELVRLKFGDRARVAAVVGEDGSRVELDVPAWRSTDSTPILRVNNRGQFRFQWFGTRSRLPGLKAVRAIEVTM